MTLVRQERFDFGGEQVRVVMHDGEPWFVAADVAKILGYTNPAKAIRDHCKGVNESFIPTPGGRQTVKVIPERDIYRLVMRSRLPSAERFEEWVVGEVLPAIRKTGSYGTQDALKALADPATLRQLLLENVEKVIALEGEVAESRPKVEVYDRIVDSGDTVGFREAAKLIFVGTGAKEPEVKGFMLRAKWIQRLGGRLATASYGQQKGYVTTRDKELKHLTSFAGKPVVIPELRITQKGVARAIERLNAESSALDKGAAE